MGDKDCDGILTRNLDLQLEKNLFSKEQIREEALLTVVVDKKRQALVKASNINVFLKSLYDQCMPSFLVIIDRVLEDELDKEYLQMPNLSFKEEVSNYEAETPLVMYADTRILHSTNSIKMIVSALLINDKLDYATAPTKVFKGDALCHSVQELAFTVCQVLRKGKQNKRVKADILDSLLGNKIFRTSIASTALVSLDGLNAKKLINASMIVRGDDSFIIKECANAPSTAYISVKKNQKIIEDKIVSWVKKHFTKEDVKRLLRRDI